MNRVFHKTIQTAGVAAFMILSAAGALAGESQARLANKDGAFSSPLIQGRSPASVNPLLDNKPVESKRAGVSLLQEQQPNKARWRLMGTCRQDSGMHRSQSGLGYGDCSQ